MFACRVNEPECVLIDFHCSELGLKLRNGIELVARRPYPNKHYLVACRNVGQKAMDGFFVETTEHVHEFTTSTRWLIGDELIVNHQVQYCVLDHELDAITESMVLWYAMSSSLGGFARRWPTAANDLTPASAQPRMELVSRDRSGHYVDRLDNVGRIIERAEVFQLHTVERDRVLYCSNTDIYARIPTADMAFTATI
jgi:hypothetical protein